MEPLKTKFLAFHEQHPGVPLREAARDLEVTEAQLLSVFYDDGALRLREEWPALLARLPSLGRLSIEVRRDNAILECRDTFSAAGESAVLSGLSSTLAAHFDTWRYLWAVDEETHEGELQSLQIFDLFGESTVKIYLDKPTPEYEAFVRDWTREGQEPLEQVESVPQQTTDTERYSTWDKKAATYVTARTVQRMLENIAKQGLKLEIYLSNRGAKQSVRGTLDRVFLRGPWLVAANAAMKAQLRFSRLGSAWILNHPDSPALSIEYFDKTGDAMLGFTLAEPDKAHRKIWEAVLSEIPRIR